MILHTQIGIGHTRWATHGEPFRENAHPHSECGKRIALVHNGIIENYAELKAWLQKRGHRFSSQTDTEVASHLIEEYYRGSIEKAFRKALNDLKGFFSFLLISSHDPEKLYLFKRSNPLIIGLGKEENFVASDVAAVLPYTDRVIYLEDDEMGVIEGNKFSFVPLRKGIPVRKKISHITWNVSQAEKAGYSHFMLKEITEQPSVMRLTLQNLGAFQGDIQYKTLTARAISKLKKMKRVLFVSCGTAYHAGLVASYMAEEHVRIPAEAIVSSEFRYQDPIVGKDDVVVVITQSGETADTLAALREAKAKGAFTLAVVNVQGSTIAREAHSVIYTYAGPEIGVASTKAYLAQLGTLALLSLYLGRLRGKLSTSELKRFLGLAKRLPHQIEEVFREEGKIKDCAQGLYQRKSFIYLGRGYNYPTALEGALKLKEITYAHAHGYPAGEMKHGPIAMIDENFPTVAIALKDSVFEKMLSNIQEIRARQGKVLALTTEDAKDRIDSLADVIRIPKTLEMLSPILSVVPLQLFAYYFAVKKGLNVDQPRNLAKSVTVE
jgi:glucosamine--fructose-6-phosphate aminotransferase (isomerizing)